MTLGIIILLIATLGFFSNFLNWKFLNYKITRYLYYIGAFVHESSHALLCIFTGAKIEEYKVLSSEPHVTHTKSKLGIVGQALISSAPIFGGILFLFLVNYFIPALNLKILNVTTDWKEILFLPLQLLSHVNYLSWQGVVMLMLFINAGAMIGPSVQDIKNAWPMFLLLVFINIPSLSALCFTALIIILANIYLQIGLIIITTIVKKITSS